MPLAESEFESVWATLIAALGFTPAEATRVLYQRALAELLDELPSGTFAQAIKSLMLSPDFAMFTQYRRLPTLDEIREECRAKAREPEMTEERREWRQRYFEQQYGERAQEITPGNTGHGALLKLSAAPKEERDKLIVSMVKTALKPMP